jgi:hypothetical protein
MYWIFLTSGVWDDGWLILLSFEGLLMNANVSDGYCICVVIFGSVVQPENV